MLWVGKPVQPGYDGSQTRRIFFFDLE